VRVKLYMKLVLLVHVVKLLSTIVQKRSCYPPID